MTPTKPASAAVACLLLLLTATAGAQARISTTVEASGKVEQGLFSSKELFDLRAQTGVLDLQAGLSINSDGRYGADIANFRDAHSLFDTYYLMEKGFAEIKLNPITFQIGRIPQEDPFDSPYSLFINSRHPSATGAVFTYQDSFFRYESRWIRLNDRSDLGSDVTQAWSSTGGYPDRGANIKTLTFQLGHQTFGVQDAGVYTGRSFDLEYFVSPMPEYFTQYFYGTGGRPWATGSNENNLIGFFWTWDESLFRLGAQVLIDDFSLHFLLPDQVPNNPWKAAWTVGAEMKTWAGTFGLHHAGALKYTFEPIDTTLGEEGDTAYGYTLYPETRYGVDGGYRAFEIADNALGYLHGENNLAVLLTWTNTFQRSWTVSSNLEFLLAGANSPANPWQQALGSYEVGTHWVDDPVLQQSVVWTTDLRWVWGDWQLFAQVKLGGVWHALELRQLTTVGGGSASAVDQYVQIYVPSDTNRAIGALVIGGSYHFDLTRAMTGS